MKTLLITATALSMSGAAFAYQTTPSTAHQSSTPPLGTATQERAWQDQQQMQTQQGVEVPHQHHSYGQTPQTAQPSIYQSTPPLGTATQERAWLDARQQMVMNWGADQRRLAEEHWAYYPTHWTEQQRTAYQQMMAHPPAHWSADQRALYEEHMRSFPAHWTPEQRTAYQQQMAGMHQPWGTQQFGQAGMQGQTSAYWTPDQWAGMGGPYEEVYGDGTIDLTPRPAQTNYPPCTPGPGDDRCIQLYEPGVRTQLSQWNQTTGGLSGSAVGMGGPYEAAPGYTAGKTDVTYQGVGGPVDARTGYPPCQPGPGDDRCIQLYERGVTGRDN